jgi:hypothetical protein
MLRPVNLFERLLATEAFLPYVPASQNIPQQAVFRCCLNLPQALLTATATFGPARTRLQTQFRNITHGSRGGVPGIHHDTSRRLRLRTGDYSGPAEFQVYPYLLKDEQQQGEPYRGNCDINGGRDACLRLACSNTQSKSNLVDSGAEIAKQE